MSHLLNLQLRRWSLAFVLLSTLSVLSVCMVNRPEERPAPAFQFNESVFNQPSVEEATEARLQSKAEKMLEGLGEKSPVVSVTVQVNRAAEMSKDFSVDQGEPVTESMQVTSESLFQDGLPFEKHKKAVNYRVGERLVTTTSFGPRLEKVHCLALVSAKNESRCREIEQALSVALGLDSSRGDRVKVMVR